MDNISTCREHNYFICETEGDGSGGWRTRQLMCAKCLQLLPYKEVLKLNKAKPIFDETIINI